MPNIGISIQPKFGSICAEYRPIYSAMTEKPVGLDKYAQNWLVKEWVKTRSLWTRADKIDVRAVHTNDNGEAMLNWKQPAGGADVCVNGIFSSDTGWTKEAGWTIPGTGFAVAAATTGNLYQGVLTALKTYKITYTVSDLTGGTVRCMAGATAGTTRSANGTYEQILYCTTNANLIIDGVTAFTGKISNVSAIPWTNSTAFYAPVFTARQGLLYDGATKYTNLNWNASVNGVNFVQDSASQIMYIRTDISVGSYAHGTANNADSKDCLLVTRDTVNKAYIRTNDATQLWGANANGSGLYINTRTAAAINKLYRNAAPIINGTTASTGVPTNNPFEGAYSDDGVAAGFRGDEVALHKYMNGCDQNDVNEENRIINGYMSLLSTNVY